MYTPEQIEAITTKLIPIKEQELRQLYEDMLDGCHDEVEIAGYRYSTSCALRAVDRAAYDCGYSDWLDSADNLININDEYYQADLIEQVIDDLEDFDSTEESGDRDDAFIS